MPHSGLGCAVLGCMLVGRCEVLFVRWPATRFACRPPQQTQLQKWAPLMR